MVRERVIPALERLADKQTLESTDVSPALLIAEIKNRRAGAVALGGAVVALSLVEFTPAGVPVLAASLVALWGLRRAKGPT